jgi:hypothetical protein
MSGVLILAQRNALAQAYGVAAPYGTLFTGAGPGSTGAATNECTAGSPAFARKPLNWSAPSASAITGTATFDVGAGTTLTFAGVCVSATLGTADVRDAIPITNQTMASQGTYAATVTYTQA